MYRLCMKRTSKNNNKIEWINEIQKEREIEQCERESISLTYTTVKRTHKGDIHFLLCFSGKGADSTEHKYSIPTNAAPILTARAIDVMTINTVTNGTL